MRYEAGVVEAHPLKMMWLSVLSVWRTWRHARAMGLPCNHWYAVYEEGSEVVMANCGPLPGASKFAEQIADFHNSKSQ